MKITTIAKDCLYSRREDNYTIKFEIRTGHKQKEKIQLTFSKWSVESELETDADWNFDEKSQKIYDQLDEPIQTEIWDYIIEIK